MYIYNTKAFQVHSLLFRIQITIRLQKKYVAVFPYIGVFNCFVTKCTIIEVQY